MTETDSPEKIVSKSGVLEGTVDDEKLTACERAANHSEVLSVDNSQAQQDQRTCAITDADLPEKIESASEVSGKNVDDEKLTACDVDNSQGEQDQSACAVEVDAAQLPGDFSEYLHQVTPRVDPKERAMTYLEESGAIRMFQVCRSHITVFSLFKPTARLIPFEPFLE